MSLRPLIVIVGTTGVGKSALAIDIALALRSYNSNQSNSNASNVSNSNESNSNHSNDCPDNPKPAPKYTKAKIINADAMQVYAGLPVLTNKLPTAEQHGVEHCLMGFRQPGEQYVVGQWVRDAVRLIDEAHAAHELPIVVGGTSYWIQHLLFPGRLANDDPVESRTSSPSPTSHSPPVASTSSPPPSTSSPTSPPALPLISPSPPPPTASPALTSALASLPAPLLALFNALPSVPPTVASSPQDAQEALELHTLLSTLDPPVGARWHWRDTRKVLRELEVVRERGRLVSEVIGEQSARASTSTSDSTSKQNGQNTGGSLDPIEDIGPTEDSDADVGAGVPKPRYHTLCFWLWAHMPILHERLNRRVDAMIEQGLLDEVRALHALASNGNRQGDEEKEGGTDYTLGIYQSIGYREFHAYLTAYPEEVSLPSPPPLGPSSSSSSTPTIAEHPSSPSSSSASERGPNASSLLCESTASSPSPHAVSFTSSPPSPPSPPSPSLNHTPSPADKQHLKAKELAFKSATDRMKTSTRQYAKRQVSWIRNKLLPVMYAANAASSSLNGHGVRNADEGGGENDSKTYLLDATDLTTWDTTVRLPAVQITRDFLSGKPTPDPLGMSDAAREMLSVGEKDTDPTANLHARRKRTCPTCTLDPARPVMIEAGGEWEAHLKTRGHRRLVGREARVEEARVWRERREKEWKEKEMKEKEGGRGEEDVEEESGGREGKAV